MNNDYPIELYQSTQSMIFGIVAFIILTIFGYAVIFDVIHPEELQDGIFSVFLMVCIYVATFFGTWYVSVTTYRLFVKSPNMVIKRTGVEFREARIQWRQVKSIEHFIYEDSEGNTDFIKFINHQGKEKKYLFMSYEFNGKLLSCEEVFKLVQKSFFEYKSNRTG